jgi:Domain of unknown function (DUF4177)
LRVNVLTFQLEYYSLFSVVFMLVKWEYKVIPIKTQIHSDHSQAEKKPVMEDVQNDLNVLGNEGWELVSVQDIRLPDGRMFTVAYLKKQKH